MKNRKRQVIGIKDLAIVSQILLEENKVNNSIERPVTYTFHMQHVKISVIWSRDI